MSGVNTLKEVLSSAPDSQLDASMVELVRKWSDPPTALQLLEVADLTIFGSLGSRIVVTAIQLELEQAMARECITHEELVKLAVWRPEDDRR